MHPVAIDKIWACEILVGKSWRFTLKIHTFMNVNKI